MRPDGTVFAWLAIVALALTVFGFLWILWTFFDFNTEAR